MNWQAFSTIGYLSIALGVGALAVWLLHWFRPHRFLPYIGFGLALAALIGARHNSTNHVSLVQVDPSIQLAKMADAQREKEQAMIESRTDQVDNIQFAEDSRGENLDTAGMDEVDLKYMKAIIGEDEPAWKSNKKQRGENAEQDDSLESKIGAKTKTEGAYITALQQEQAPEPILMDEASVVLSQKLDLWNLNFTFYLMILAAVVLMLDYLRRANIYQEAMRPVPLPSSWLQAFTPLPVIFNQPDKARRDITSQLAWFTRRGDQWIYFTDRQDKTEDIRSSLAILKRWPYRLDLIEVDERITNELVMESAWYGRASFICDDSERALSLLGYCLSQLKHRRITRARAPQYVHLVWDCAEELSDQAFEAFKERASHSRMSLYIIPKKTKPSEL